MLAGDGEVAAPVVSLKASLAVTPLWQRGSQKDVNTGAGWTNLRVGVELLDNLLGPSLHLSSLRVEAAVQVHTAKIVFRREHEAYATVTVLLAGSHSLLVATPSIRIRAACPLARRRGIRDLS